MTINQHDHLVAKCKRMTPTYRFDERWQNRVEAWRAGWWPTFCSLIHELPPCDPNPRWEKLIARDGYTLHRVLYATEPGLDAAAYVGIPDHLTERVPGVLCIHGHGLTGAQAVAGYGDHPELANQIVKYNYDYGRRLTEHGVVTFIPTMRGFGERISEFEIRAATKSGHDPCDINFVHQMLMGEVAMACQLRELQVALNLLGGLEQVDAGALGCVGLSYGGRLATFIAALDQRLRATVVSGALSSFAERIETYATCGYQVLPGILRHGDTAEVLGLIAPRALALEVGRGDHACCPQPAADREFVRAQRIFRAVGAAEQLKLITFDGEHVFDGPQSLPWLLEQLGAKATS